MSRLDSATARLAAEITRCADAGDPPMRKRQDAEPFLAELGLNRAEARDLLNDRNGMAWTLQPSENDKRIIHVLPLVRKEEDGHNSGFNETPQTQASVEAERGRAHRKRAATSDPNVSGQQCEFEKAPNLAETTNFSPGDDGVADEEVTL